MSDIAYKKNKDMIVFQCRIVNIFRLSSCSSQPKIALVFSLTMINYPPLSFSNHFFSHLGFGNGFINLILGENFLNEKKISISSYRGLCNHYSIFLRIVIRTDTLHLDIGIICQQRSIVFQNDAGEP